MHINRERLKKLYEEDAKTPAEAGKALQESGKDPLLAVVKDFSKDKSSSADPISEILNERLESDTKSVSSEDPITKILNDKLDSEKEQASLQPPKLRNAPGYKKLQAEKAASDEAEQIQAEKAASDETEQIQAEKAASDEAEQIQPEIISFEDAPQIQPEAKTAAEADRKERRKLPGKYILLGAVLFILLAAAAFKVYMDVSFRPVTEVRASDYKELNISVTDNQIEVRNPNRSNKGEKTAIIFYSDLRVDGECYLPLMIALAEKGYDCFLPTALGNQTYLNVDGADTIIRQFSGFKKWALVGHSRSCDTAAAYAEGNPDRLNALIFLGGFSDRDLSRLDLSLLSIIGTKDTVVNLTKAEAAKAEAPRDSVYVTLSGGNNSGFINSGLLTGDSKADITQEEQIRQTAEQIDRFLSRTP